MVIKVRIDTTNLDTDYRVQKARQAGDALYKIINSDAFKREILAMSDEWRQGEESQYKKMGTHDLYHFIISGKEEWNKDDDNELDLLIHDYQSSWFGRNVIGYMNPGKPEIYVNTRHFDSAQLKYVVSNFLHEYTHTLGFRHGGPNLHKSIPYYMNEVVEKLWDEVIKDKEPEETKPNGYWSCNRLWYTLWIKKKCWWVSL